MDKQKSKRCPNAVGGFSAITVDGKKIVAGALVCNSWKCSICAPRLKKKLQSRIYNGAIGEEFTSKYGFKFLTFTFGGNDKREPYRMHADEIHEVRKDPNRKVFITGDHLSQTYWSKRDKKFKTRPVYNEKAMHEAMNVAFHKMIRALKKKYGNFHYFKICELHEDGVPHFHVLFAGNAIIPKSILNSIEKLWQKKYGLGHVKVNCVKFRNKKHAVNYMLKYITKDIQQVGKYKRIFTASRHSLTKIIKKEWLMVKVKIGRVTDQGIKEISIDESTLIEAAKKPSFCLEEFFNTLLWRNLPTINDPYAIFKLRIAG